MGERLILFCGVYDTLDIFSFNLEKGFKALGYETLMVNVKDENALAQLNEFVKMPVKAVVTFNNVGFIMTADDGTSIWDNLGIVSINILVDHPANYHEALTKAPKLSAVLCIDRLQMDYVHRFYPHIPITGFLPHGGTELQQGRIPIKDRKIDILYAGGLSANIAHIVVPNLKKYVGLDSGIFSRAVIQKAIAEPDKTIETVIEECLNEQGVVYEDNELAEVISDFCALGNYAVCFYREQVIRRLVESGLKITIIGSGWDVLEWINAENVTYLGRVSANDSLNYMLQSKIVLNTMTWFKDGSHERIFNGMLAGSVVVSDKSRYLEELFPDSEFNDDNINKAIEFFDLRELDLLPGYVQELLLNEDLMQDIANRGFQVASESHTWNHRAQEIHEDLLSQL